MYSARRPSSDDAVFVPDASKVHLESRHYVLALSNTELLRVSFVLFVLLSAMAGLAAATLGVSNYPFFL